MDTFNGGQYKPLKEEDVGKIHRAVTDILQKAGIKVYTKTGFERFKNAGAEVDENTRTVKISKTMLEDAIASCPHKLVLCGREEKNDVLLEGSRVHLGTGGTAIYVLDLETGERRYSTNADVKKMALLVDALPNVHLFTINVFPNDIKEVNNVDVNRFFSSITNTTKHVMGGIYSIDGLKQTVEMASLIAGGRQKLRERPFVSFITLIISPLKIDDIYGEMTCYLAKEGLPVVCPAEPLCGTTSPVTLASNVLMHCAESLAGVVLTQIINKGAPVLFGSVGSITDLRSMGHLSGAIERGMINSAVSQMAQFYKIPYYSTAGTSDSKSVDVQSGYESAMSNLLVTMSGANYIHDAAGLMEFDLTVSYEKLVIDNEIIGMCMRVLRGIEVNDDTLAVDLICDVGAGGDFLGQSHTVQYMRTEFFKPEIADREHRETGIAANKEAFRAAKEKVKELLLRHKPVGLDSETEKNIRNNFKNIL